MAEPPRTPPAPSRRREIRRLLGPALLVALMGVIALVYSPPWTPPAARRRGRPRLPRPRRELRRLRGPALLVALRGVIALVYSPPWPARPALRVAVARFDNENGNKDYDRFPDALT